MLVAELSAGAAPPPPLALDDYHVIREPRVHQAVEALLPCLSLILTSRDDPLLPLPRLRAQGRDVFAKLEAACRTEAVAKARELGLLPNGSRNHTLGRCRFPPPVIS